MALEMNKEVNSGFTADYWKITRIDFNTINSVSFVELSLYKDNAASTAGKKRVYFQTFTWDDSDYPFSVSAMDTENPITIAYNKIKTLEEFNSAVDV